MIVLFGSTGLYASISLLLTKIERLKNVDFVPTCSVSYWYDCSSVMDSKWSQLTGYPNYINGIVLYSLAIMTGLFILSNKTNDKRVMWFAMLLSGAGLFVNINLLYVSAFIIQAICLWCVLSIVSTTGVFLSVLNYNINQGFLGEGKKVEFYKDKVHFLLLFGMYIFVFAMVFGVKQMVNIWPEFYDVNWPNTFFWIS